MSQSRTSECRAFLEELLKLTAYRCNVVRPPSQLVRQGTNSVLSPGEVRLLLDTIPTTNVAGFRDRALIALVLYTFARVSAAISTKVRNVMSRNGRTWVRLEDKGGKLLELPAHRVLAGHVSAYLDTAAIRSEKKSPLFRAGSGRERNVDTRTDEPSRCLSHDPASRPRRYLDTRRLSHVSRYRDHGVLEEWWPTRDRPSDGLA